MAKYCSFVCRLRKIRWKMLHLSVPKHFDHGVSKKRQPFVSNTTVDMFGDTFFRETPVWLTYFADIGPKNSCLPTFNQGSSVYYPSAQNFGKRILAL